MTDFSPKVSQPFLMIGAAVLLASLYFAVRFFSGKRQRDAVRELQEYFNLKVCPRSELAPYLRELPLYDGPLCGGKLPEMELPCPREWMEREDEELNSPYYLRTQQQVSMLSAMAPAGSWYGLEAWIRDILASKGDPCGLAGAGPKSKPENGEK